MESGTVSIFDVEAAAMLVSDLHHKATAAMREDHSDEDSSSLAYSPHRSSVMESSVTYPSGAIATPQVQWDGFMSQSVTEPKAHSITSSTSGSFESQQS